MVSTVKSGFFRVASGPLSYVSLRSLIKKLTFDNGSISQRYGSGSGSFYRRAKIVKNLDSYYFVTLFVFLSLKNDVNVSSKSNKQKKLFLKIGFLWHLEGQWRK